MHVIAAKAVALGEALKPEFKEYAKQIIANCQALAEGLIAEGFRLVSGGTDNHLLLVDVRGQKMTGKIAEHLLDEVGVTCNKNTIPFDPESPFVTSGIRLGTAAVTTRGSGLCLTTPKMRKNRQKQHSALRHYAQNIQCIPCCNR